LKKSGGDEGEIMKIHHATREKVNEIYLFGKKVHELDFSKKYPFHQRAELTEATSDKNSILLVAEENKEVVGFLLAKIIFYRAGGWCMLDNIAVRKDFQGNGISNLLLKSLYLILRKRKVHYVQVLEEMHHKNTRKFWKHEGFRETKKFIWAEKGI